MNERIKELSIKAGFPEWSNHAIEFELEQFAELIVRECAGVCDLYAMPDGTSETAIILSAAIKRKFGMSDEINN